MDDKITKILEDAVIKHNLVLNIKDQNIRDLVSYVLLIGYNDGWKDHKEEMGKE